MAQERSEGIVLRGVDYSETSRIMTFLTPDQGKLACIAQGAKRKKSPFGGILDTFNRLELVYYTKASRSVQKLAEASLLAGYYGIKRDFAKGAYGTFLLELASNTAFENAPCQTLYDELVRALEGLNAWTGDACTYTCWHALRLLREAGFFPELTYCIDTGRPAPKAPGFLLRGGVTCRVNRADFRLSERDYTCLRALAMSSECPDLPAMPRLFKLLAQYSAHQLETGFRSARVIEQMFSQDPG